ncbi:MAG: MarR family transcriptional regulator [Dehalococcoidales bacterium]|nr:MarR family transcriptional regulator [Dehalococcoidales bacterium]
MVERIFKRGVKETKEELLQRFIEQMSSVMKRVHHGMSLQEPPLSPPQARLLFMIAGKEKEGTSVKELAEQTNVTPGAITQFVDVLVEKKLVKRYQDPKDRRMVKLIITTGAKRQLEKFRKNFLSSVIRAFDALSEDEIKQLIELLSKVGSCSDSKQCNDIGPMHRHRME